MGLAGLRPRGRDGSSDELERGRTAYARRAWLDAYESLAAADRVLRLGAQDLELLATSAYMLGRAEDYLRSLERAYQLHRDAGEPLRAVRCAFWVGLSLALQGESGRAGGWLGRAQRLLERAGRDCVERGYLLTPVMFEREAAGDLEDAAAIAADVAAIGERFGDADLFALAVHSQGSFLVKLGRVREGLGLLDEAMVAVTAEELSPIASGLVYCGVILGCQEAYEPRRAREWTAALTRWCEQQPDMVAFTGRCLTHRAEIMCLRGAWQEALEEARRAPGARRRGTTGWPAARPRMSRASCIACAARVARPSAPTAKRAGSVASRNPASLCCGSRREITRRGRRDPPCAGRGARAAAAHATAARLRRDHARRR